MASAREEALKKAEKLLRTGKLDLAIAEYAKMIEDQPRDWNTRNILGDLYVRANQPDKAVAQYEQIADHLYTEGFFPKAGALYKKILKIKPDLESAQLHLGDISAKQGLLADAKAYFVGVASRRRARGDKAGADEIVVRLGSLDPGDFDARAAAAQTLERAGDTVAAAMQYRSMHADLLEKGRTADAMGALREAVRLNPDDTAGRVELGKAAIAEGNTEAAKQYLDRAVAGSDPALLFAVMEIELRSGGLDTAREIIAELLQSDPSIRTRIVDLAWTVAAASPEGAFVCINTAVDAELAAGNYMDAAAILQEFVTRVSGQIDALLRLVEICVDGGLEATMYETQAQLADAYLERGQGLEARVIAEDLVAREPWEHAHIERFRRALEMLDVPDPDAIIADRLAGQGPFVATDPFMAPESFGEEPAEPILKRAEDRLHAPAAEPHDEAPPAEMEAPVTEDAPRPPAPEAGQAREGRTPPPGEPDIPLRPRAAAAPTPPPHPPASDIDLNQVLDQMGNAAPGPTQNLDEVFNDFRSEISKQTGTHEAAEQLGLAKTYLEMGMSDEAMTALRTAARSPGHRFEASSMLGRLYLKKKDLPHAIEWLERAAEAPAPSANDARQLLYELGALLEATGETSRALAVFLELQADAGEYRDVAARVERLSKVQTGG